MRIVVTGASGLLGAHVVRAAQSAGHEVRAVVRSSPGEALKDCNVPHAVADVLGGVDVLVAAFSGADTLVHCAAVFAYGRGEEEVSRVATLGTRNVLAAAKEAGVRRVVVTSSSVVFGYSIDPEAVDEGVGLADPAGQPDYVAAKIAQHRLALDQAEHLGIEVVFACPTLSIGGYAAVLGPSNALITTYLADPTRSTFDGGCNLVAADDIGRAHVILAERGEAGASYLLGSENLGWPDIHAMIGVLTGVGGPYLTLGRQGAALIARGGEALALLTGGQPASSTEQANMLGRYYWYSSERAAALGFAPKPAATALIEAVSWLAASKHISREVRATMRLADEVQQHRFASARQ